MASTALMNVYADFAVDAQDSSTLTIDFSIRDIVQLAKIRPNEKLMFSFAQSIITKGEKKDMRIANLVAAWEHAREYMISEKETLKATIAAANAKKQAEDVAAAMNVAGVLMTRVLTPSQWCATLRAQQTRLQMKNVRTIPWTHHRTKNRAG